MSANKKNKATSIEVKKEHPKEKSILHPRNKHRERYDFKQLIVACPELAPFVLLNRFNDESIDFFNPEAVKILNWALLKFFYGIGYWDIPPTYLCPPIPGRADYIHYIADLLGNSNGGIIPTGNGIKCLDIGVGANCVYPIIGNSEYGWTFIGSDIDKVAIESATKIVELNPTLKDQVEMRLQPNRNNLFKGIIREGERFDITLCNPPFHASMAEAQAGTIRKLTNLKQKRVAHPTLNFGGQSNELWCEGGEEKFVGNMIRESIQFAANCSWFSTLISKESNVNSAISTLKGAKAVDVKTIAMGQGNKKSRILVWTFQATEQKN
jgi:23S rRNA (adenine1618-N6)-methyltransferase